MAPEYETATANGNTDRCIRCAAAAAFEQIEEYNA